MCMAYACTYSICIQCACMVWYMYMYMDFILFTQSLGKGEKKVIPTDEWRNGSVKERLKHSLVKVIIITLMCI